MTDETTVKTTAAGPAAEPTAESAAKTAPEAAPKPTAEQAPEQAPVNTDLPELLQVGPNPHLFTNVTTRRIMLDVLIALCPAAVAAVLLFGLRALFVIAVCLVFSVGSEAIFNLCVKKKQTVGDLSAAVTGLILALNMPVTIPLWQAALGAITAVIVVKCLFGGLGQNFANPADVGRIVLFVSFPATMKAATDSFKGLLGSSVDMVTGATPLTQLNGGEEASAGLLDLLFGTYGGMMGETCAIALLLGLIYLLVRRVISWHIPVSILATVAVFSLCAGRPVLVDLLSGGLLLGAVFMATDYVTSPTTNPGKIVFGVGIGLVTMFVRVFCAFPEGMSFAILLFNILTPYIEKLTARRPFGVARKAKRGGAGA